MMLSRQEFRDNRKNSHQGFTLIELLLGLSIFSVIALTIYGTFSAGIRLNRRAQQQGQLEREISMTFQLMSLELQNMVPYDFSGSYPDRFAVSGSSESIEFILATKEGLKVIRYALLRPEESYIHKIVVGGTYKKNVDIVIKDEFDMKLEYLIREETSLIDAVSEGFENDAADQEVIATQIKNNGLRFAYGYYESADSEDISWGDQWQQKTLPLQIKVSIDFVTHQEDQKALSFTKLILIPSGVAGEQE